MNPEILYTYLHVTLTYELKMMEQYLVKKETVEWIMGIRRIVTERNKIKGGKRK